jgi:CRP-like cAMP-binding protein
VLDVITDDGRARLQPHLRLVHLTHGQVLTEAGDARRNVWFPTTGVLSMLGIGAKGDVFELATIGPSSYSDALVTLDAAEAIHRVIVRRAGGAYRIPEEIVRRELHANAGFRRALNAAALDVVRQITAATMCVAFHPLLPRLCRWLLVSLDYAHSETIDLTQEFIAQMLGVTRPRVSQALLILEAQRFIHQGVGRIHIVNRAGLEALTCDCYRQQRKAIA